MGHQTLGRIPGDVMMDTIAKIDKAISMCDADDNEWETMILDALTCARASILLLQEDVSNLERQLQDERIAHKKKDGAS